MRSHWLSVLSILSAVLLADLATPPAQLWGDVRVKHSWKTAPTNWESLGPPPASTTIDLHIALKPHHENALIDALYEVSDPAHKKYGAHLTKEQVADLVAPHQDTLKIVHSWLGHHGVPSSSISTSHGGGWLTITGVPVSQADELLGASYQLYRHIGTNETEVTLRTVSYALPVVLHAHVQTVAPTTHFASPRRPLQTPHSSEEAAAMINATSGELVGVLSRDQYHAVTPTYLRWLYNTQYYEPAAIGQNVLGILGFQTGSASQTDFSLFMNSYWEDATDAEFTVVDVSAGAGSDPGPISSVANVNTQYAAAIAFPTPQIYYSTSGSYRWSPTTGASSPGDAYLDWFNYVINQPNIPPTISILYNDPEPLFPREYAKAVCGLFARLGALGVSVLAASGDHGVGQGSCTDSSGSVDFIPMFPASCPWVTSVGGTTGQILEFAASFSGGGFSRYFLRESFQGPAVLNFFEHLGTQYAANYNPDGRGIPDVAAQAIRFVFFQDGTPHFASGTSCSTAAVAGIVSLLNDYLLSTRRKPLGFLNMWLYGRCRRGLNDITSGSNPGCDTDGFPAIAGWNPVTGLGTLDFQQLQRILDT